MDENEQIETLKRWWERFGTYVVVLLVAGLGSFIGWHAYQDYTQRQAEQAAGLYAQYLDLRGTGVLPEDAEAIEEMQAVLDRIDRDHAGTSYHTFTLFYRAADAAEWQDFERAANYLREAVESGRAAHLRDVARLRLARALQELGESEQALATLRAVSGEGFRARVAELKGDIRLAQGDREAARAAYEQALELAEPERRRGLLEMKLADLAGRS